MLGFAVIETLATLSWSTFTFTVAVVACLVKYRFNISAINVQIICINRLYALSEGQRVSNSVTTIKRYARLRQSSSTSRIPGIDGDGITA